MPRKTDSGCRICGGLLHTNKAHEVPCRICGVVALFHVVGESGQQPTYMCNDEKMHDEILNMWKLTVPERDYLRAVVDKRKKESVERVRKAATALRKKNERTSVRRR